MALAPVLPLTSLRANPLDMSNGLLTLSRVRMSVHGRDRLPPHQSMVVVSNHRSIMDAPLLMSAVGRPVRFACHHYMSQVPGLRNVINALGCLPLDAPDKGQTAFFRRARKALGDGEAVGIFPEGAAPMVSKTAPDNLNAFHRGFAHLALRAPVDELAIVPVAIAARRETSNSVVPLRLLSLFDASEPLFQQPGWHPAVFYQEVNVMIGRPVRVDDRLRSHYRSKGTNTLAAEIAQCCQDEIATLLKQGFY
ncbi:lysophospholipid acyltransferase family protein [Leptolyngbya sp. CCNP1308]|uniref:lysophospholipid acyltransferase family protein n=1 Tax=Leptolyngbya sp. CCNP1308 TaxID=3110255 RepID=UPI002B2002D4|nr:lysophospholipid acyltransferase family protein [Leptolyngbya sp. CCNP1308]MEA5451330.1 lysophospholipid acyltransferase family protein [Leptolyngbya sp. CCNP1308]